MLEFFVSKVRDELHSAFCLLPHGFMDIEGGNEVRVESRSGAILMLCRELTAMGVPDQAWQAFWMPRKPSLSGPSIRRTALLAVVETDTNAPRLNRWKAFYRADNPKCPQCGTADHIYKAACLSCAAQGVPNYKIQTIRPTMAQAQDMLA